MNPAIRKNKLTKSVRIIIPMIEQLCTALKGCLFSFKHHFQDFPSKNERISEQDQFFSEVKLKKLIDLETLIDETNEGNLIETVFKLKAIYQNIDSETFWIVLIEISYNCLNEEEIFAILKGLNQIIIPDINKIVDHLLQKRYSKILKSLINAGFISAKEIMKKNNSGWLMFENTSGQLVFQSNEPIALSIRNDDLDCFIRLLNIEINESYSEENALKEVMDRINKYESNFLIKSMCIYIIDYTIVNGASRCFDYLVRTYGFPEKERCIPLLLLNRKFDFFLNKFSKDDINMLLDNIEYVLISHNLVIFDWIIEAAENNITNEKWHQIYKFSLMFKSFYAYQKSIQIIKQIDVPAANRIHKIASRGEKMLIALGQLPIKKKSTERKHYQSYIAEIKEMKKGIENLRCTLMRKDKEIKELNKTIEEVKNNNVIKNLDPIDQKLLINCSNNVPKGKHAFYPEEIKHYWLHLANTMTYSDFLEFSKRINGPAMSTIRNWRYNLKNNICVDELQSILKIKNVIQFWKKVYNLQDGTTGILSVDAFKVDEDVVISDLGIIAGIIKGENEDMLLEHPPEFYTNVPVYENLVQDLLRKNMIITNCFIYLFNPLTACKSFPLMFEFSNNGFSTAETINNIEIIKTELLESNLTTLAVGHDADKGYDAIQVECFNCIINYLSNNIDIFNFTGFTVNNIFCNDPSHILKRIASRLVLYDKLYMTRDRVGTNKCISIEKIFKFDPDLPNGIIRRSNLMSMDDFRPYKMLSPKALESAFLHDDFDSVLFYIPGVIQNLILREKTLDRKKRITLCYIGFYTSMIHYYILIMNSNNSHSSAKRKYLSFFTKDQCMHTCNYLYTIITILQTVESNFPVGNIGSICAEHYIALTRREAKYDQTALSIEQAIQRIINMSSSQNKPKDQIRKRWFETPFVGAGIAILDNDECLKAFSYVVHLFKLAGVVFPREFGLYYKINKAMKLDINDETYLKNLLIMSSSFTIKATKLKKSSSSPKFRMSLSQTRQRGSCKSIGYRYANQLKLEPKNEESKGKVERKVSMNNNLNSTTITCKKIERKRTTRVARTPSPRRTKILVAKNRSSIKKH